MPPNLDIYGLTHHRDLATINDFIDNYVDRAASEDRGDGELMLDLLDGNPEDGYDSEPSISLTHIIERGLDQPPRAFANYLKAKNPDFDGSIICFTSDNLVIFSVSIDDEGAQPENFERAKQLLDEIARKYDCHLGLIGVEFPPPHSEKEFREAKNRPLLEFYKEYKPE